MRNLKRALSLALASVMLLGMMVVGSSAAFSDADEIVNKEAVEITAGLGLFAGSDGKFDPKGTVTRAQMAAVIAKMFYGSDLNADTYKGGNKFNDTAAFEGGWAEGYINLGVEKGWFKGYGDGTFKPGQAVTTAEAVTMILNLLKVDAGQGTWPMTVMAAAEDIDLFDLECELKPAPATNVAMTRDQLAVVVWNALNYSAEGVEGYKVKDCDITFKSWADAAAYADAAFDAWDATFVTEVRKDTLAETVFEIQTATGYVTGNQATGEDYTIVAGVNLNLETGLDMLGHFVTAYYSEAYKNEKNPGVAYCLVEEAEYVTVAEDIDTKKDYLAAFGSKVEALRDELDVLAIEIKSFDGAVAAPTTVAYDEVAFEAEAGTYAISLETGKIIAYIAPITYSVDMVTRVTTTAGKESIRIGTTLYKNNEDTDVIVEYAGIAEDDVVVLKNVKGVTYVEKLEAVADQKVTKTTTKDGKDYTYLNGTSYENAGVVVTAVDGMVATASASSEVTYDAYIYDGKLIGLIETAGAAALSDAIYVVGDYDIEVAGNYAPTTHYYAQGVNAAGEEVSVLIGVGTYGDTDGMAAGFYTFKKATTKEEAKRDIMVATPAVDAANFDEDSDKFFAEAVTGTVNADELRKDDKFVKIGTNTRVYLTADTKFVVIDATTVGEELEVATYTGAIAKTIASGDALTVAVALDENDNYLAQTVVIVAGSLSMKAEDYIYIVDGADFSAVEDGVEYNAYFTATNEFKTIVADAEVDTGFYGDYTIDEDGIYDLGAADDAGVYVIEDQEFQGVFNTAISSGDIDLYDAAKAVVVDVRGEEALEESNVAEFETLKDIVAAYKAEYKVFFNAIVEEDGTDWVVTHIFVTGVKVFDEEISDWVDA